MTATLFEIIWTAQMFVGLAAAGVAAFLATGDLRIAYEYDGNEVERGHGLWLVVQWAGYAIVNLCLFLIGVQALTLDTPAGRGNDATFTGLCFIAAGLVLTITPIGYLVNRWLVLRHKERDL